MALLARKICPQQGPGAEPLVRGSGWQRPPEAEAFLAFGRSIKAANLPTFLNFGNTNTSDICVIFAKNHGWPQNWGSRAKLRGLCPPPARA